ncbi:MAG: hypothetical protein A3K13_00190 [Gemmatimonadetes bacterium RIFCSPLOWO2_12_FULL_68_9]|nr:MAG: hypothetical protein A3K13_00190 [Gemmatimonadetes bacterium RIFCSPLOWO2_12_FULL_68_9]
MPDAVRRELRWLRAHALISTPLLMVLTLAAFRQEAQQTRFTEIDVERINVVEPGGKLRMVISNRPRSTGPIYQGKPFGYEGGTRPGIIFFNDEGTENGGLTFQGSRTPDGKFSAGHHLSFDQFDQDQVVVLNYSDNDGRRQVGLSFLDRADVNIFDVVAERDSIMKLPDGPAKTAALERWRAPRDGVPLAAQRVYVGRDVRRAAVLRLSDPSGRPRIQLMVDSLGAPSLEFLDQHGKVVQQLPGDVR